MTHDDKPIRRFEVELVDEVVPPPKRPPLAGDTPQAIHDRPRDYLDGFLAAAPAADVSGDDELKEAVIAALRDIFDPEIPVNIYDLGLIYGVDIADGDLFDVVRIAQAGPLPAAGDVAALRDGDRGV